MAGTAYVGMKVRFGLPLIDKNHADPPLVVRSACLNVSARRVAEKAVGRDGAPVLPGRDRACTVFVVRSAPPRASGHSGLSLHPFLYLSDQELEV